MFPSLPLGDLVDDFRGLAPLSSITVYVSLILSICTLTNYFLLGSSSDSWVHQVMVYNQSDIVSCSADYVLLASK